ncbi:MAG: hypothetical protein V8Q35_04780 [Alistipes finegoldii]
MPAVRAAACNGSYSTSYGSRNGDSPFNSGSRGSSYNNRGSSYNNRGNSYNSGSRGDFNSGSRNDFNSGSRGSSYNDRRQFGQRHEPQQRRFAGRQLPAAVTAAAARAVAVRAAEDAVMAVGSN